VGGLMDGWMDV